jgi:hypothetical protein
VQRRHNVRILDYLTGPEGQQAIGNLTRSFGVPPDQAKTALDAIVPELARSVERNTLNRGGIADLVAAMGKANPDLVLEPGADLKSPVVNNQGIEVLEQIFGSKDKSRAVAARVARQTGLQEDTIKSLLPAAAAMTMAALAKGSRTQLQDLAGKVPGLAAASPLPMPSTGGGGNLPRQSPLPIPGDNLPDINPRQGRYDDLSDVIRRGGTSVPRSGPSVPSGGNSGSLGGSIRDILGGLLGFKNRGFLGWLFQAIILPMVLRMIQSVLRRVLTGR